MKLKLVQGIALLGYLVVSGCSSSSKIATTQPDKVDFTAAVKPLSTVSAPISVNLNDVSNSINRQFPTTFYSDNNFDDNGTDNLKLKLNKRNAVIVNASNNAINVTIPLKIEGTYRFKKSVLGVDLYKEQNFAFNVKALIQSVPSIDQNWGLHLKSNTQIKWEDLPIIEFAGVKLDLQKLFSKMIQSQSAKISDYIDTEVPKMVNIKKDVSEYWSELSKPLLIDEVNKSWLLLNPKNIFATPFKMTGSELMFTTGIESVVEVVSGYKPVADKPTPLPPLKLVNSLSDNATIILSTDVTYDQINELVKAQIGANGMNLKSAEYDIIVHDATVFGNGNKLTIAINLDGTLKKGVIKKKIKGLVYLEGTPVFNKEKQAIEFTDFDFNVKTKDILVKSASWLLSSKPFRKAIEKNLVFDVSTQLKDAKNQAKDAMNKRYANFVELNGNITNIEPKEVIVTPNSLKVNILTQGKIGIKLNNF